MFNTFFSFKNYGVYEIIRYSRREATDDDIIRRMRFTCWNIKAANIHSEYIMLIAFPRQQLLRERASLSCCTYMACLVCSCHGQSKYCRLWFSGSILADLPVLVSVTRKNTACVLVCFSKEAFSMRLMSHCPFCIFMSRSSQWKQECYTQQVPLLSHGWRKQKQRTVCGLHESCGQPGRKFEEAENGAAKWIFLMKKNSFSVLNIF